MTQAEQPQELIQSYIFDCDCKNSPGIIIKDNRILCRWCKKELIKGGLIVTKNDSQTNK